MKKKIFITFTIGVSVLRLVGKISECFSLECFQSTAIFETKAGGAWQVDSGQSLPK
jgi:hypothetical protein